MRTDIAAPELRAYDEPAGVEVRSESGKKVLIGRAVPYDTETVVNGRYVEQIAASCFRKSTEEAAKRLPLLVAHEHSKLPVGSAAEWEHRADGLWGLWELGDTEAAREVHSLAEEGHLRALSVGFAPIKSDWTLAEPPALDSVVRREARLLEVSLVGVGAYEDAEVVLVRTAEGRAAGRKPHLAAWQQWRSGLA